jgi:hypothetical protein
MDFRVQQIRTLLSWIDLHKHLLLKVPSHLLLSEKQLESLDLPAINSRPDYFTLKETLNLMRQLKFPECEFLNRFIKVVE